ncbi:MAG: AbrB/MazE/SpoVT family DNA-binding domain-containing protein [Rickettsia sp.]|jgi:bifunctional DNA-binding transcriptional regulator/antitoxin component of YhaV-PrlF toxin-antitoxin module|nr:AbrB/MazE/SpoVT family DNA-binding domain-containing protein [Rickettsia sp.]
MYISTITISPKGQIVLPKKIRKILNSNTISLLVNDQNQILLTPINELGGIFSSYNKDTKLSFDEIREQSWQDSTLIKINNSSSEE